MTSRTRVGLHVAIAWIVIVAVCITGFSQQRRSANPPLNEQAIRARIKFLSSDLLEGRGTSARGGEIAANYIAAQMEALGLKGAGANGSFFQPVSLGENLTRSGFAEGHDAGFGPVRFAFVAHPSSSLSAALQRRRRTAAPRDHNARRAVPSRLSS